MIDEFWRFYGQIRFAYNYYQIIRNRLMRKMIVISVASYVVTTISLAGWATTGKAGVIWSVIILTSQIANGLMYRLNWNEERLRLAYYLSDLNVVILDLEKGWRNIVLGLSKEEKIMQLINSRSEQYKKLERRYILPCNISESTTAIKKADSITNAELRSLHGEGDDTYEQGTNAVKPKTSSGSKF